MSLPRCVTLQGNTVVLDRGALLSRVTVRKNTPSPTGVNAGGVAMVPSDVLTAYAAIESVSGGDRSGQGLTTSLGQLWITLWFDALVKSSMEVFDIASGRTYTIEHADNVNNANVALVLTCVAIGGNT